MLQLIYQLTSLYFSLNKYGENTTDRYERSYRQEAAHKCKEKYIDKLKENVLKDGEDSSSASTGTTNTTTSSIISTASAISKSSNVYVYGVCALDLLVIGACVFFA